MLNRPAPPRAAAHRRRHQDRPRRGDRGHAGRRGIRHRHRLAGRDGLHHGAPVPHQHLPGRRLHAGRGAAREVRAARRRRSSTCSASSPRRCATSWPRSACARLADVIGRTDLLQQVSRGVGAAGRPRPQPAAGAGRSRPVRALLHAGGPQRGAGDAGRADDRGRAAAVRARREDAAAVQHPQHAPRDRHASCRSRIVRKFGMTGLAARPRRRCGCAARPASRSAPSRVQGLKLEVFGDANDYVGKGLSGGDHRGAAGAILDAAQPAATPSSATPCCMARPRASCSRRARRASASPCATRAPTAVVEGCGSNGCEYMTGGTVVVLGAVGDNFGAGFTGGMAFVYDPDGEFDAARQPRHAGLAARGAPALGAACCASWWRGMSRKRTAATRAPLLHDWDDTLPRVLAGGAEGVREIPAGAAGGAGGAARLSSREVDSPGRRVLA